MKQRFKIEYVDPKTGERMSVEQEFENTAAMTAEEWATYYARKWSIPAWIQVTPLEDKK